MARREETQNLTSSAKDRVKANADKIQYTPTSRRASLLPIHPLVLTLPQLNLDGTVTEDDLTSHQSSPNPYTPPAALSSLGARARMANTNGTAVDGTTSFIDEQYDMIDDLSEISNDDHETASITSGSAGRTTPDLMESFSNLDEIANSEHALANPNNEENTIALPFVITPAIGGRQEEIVDPTISSLLSEDLETPRQSTIAARLSEDYIVEGSRDRGVARLRVEQGDETQHVMNILFVSERSIDQVEMERIVITAVLAHREENGISSSPPGDLDDYDLRFRAVSPFSGDNSPTAEVFHHTDGLAASVFHCIGAERRTADSYNIRIKDADGLHSTNYTIGKKGKISLPRPDIVIFFLRARPVYGSMWVQTAHQAMASLKTPILVVKGSGFYHGPTPRHIRDSRSLLKRSAKQAQVDGTSFSSGHHSDTMATIKQLLQHQPVCSFGRGFLRWLCGTLVVTTLLCSLLPKLLTMPRWTLDSSEILQNRRSELANVVPTLKPATVHHLLPDYIANCFQIDALGLQHTNVSITEGQHNCSSVYFDIMAPGSFIISLPGLSRFPRLGTSRVYKRFGGDMNHNMTQLIPGVWQVSVEPELAHGIIYVNMVTSRPPINVTTRHHFGGGSSVAVREVGRVLVKDAAVAKDLAHGVTETVRDQVEKVRDQVDKVCDQVEKMATSWSQDWDTWEQNARALGAELSDLIKGRIALSRVRARVIGNRIVAKVDQIADHVRLRVAEKRAARAARRVARKTTRVEKRKAKQEKSR